MASWGMPCFFVSLKLCVWKKNIETFVLKKMESNVRIFTDTFENITPPPHFPHEIDKSSQFFVASLSLQGFRKGRPIRSGPGDTGIPNWHLPTSRSTGPVPHIASGSTAPCGYQMQHLSDFLGMLQGGKKDSSNCEYPFHESGGVDRFASVRKRTFKRITGLSSLTFCCSCFSGKSSTSHCITLAKKKQLPA